MTLICEDCGACYESGERESKKPLDRPAHFQEEFYTLQTELICPECLGGLSPAMVCAVCGEMMPEGDRVCNKCKNRLEMAVAIAVRRSQELFSELITEAAQGNAEAMQYMEDCI